MPNNPIKMQPPLFMGYVYPNGHLTEDYETHALWYYYLLANKNRLQEADDYRLDTQFMPISVNYRNLFVQIAKLYNVNPEAMEKCWNIVDKQCLDIDMPLLPDKYRRPADNGIFIIDKLH